MSKDTYWFPHDQDAHSDPKMRKLRRQYGAEGYGIYWMIIEALRAANGYELSMDNIEDIAYDMHVVPDIMRLIIVDFDLFVIEENIFYSQSLKDRMFPWDERRRKLSEAGKRGGRPKKETAPDSQETHKKKGGLNQVKGRRKGGESQPKANTVDKSRVNTVEESKYNTVQENASLVRAREEPTIEMDIIKTGTLIDRMKVPWDALHKELADSPQKWEGQAERNLITIKNIIEAKLKNDVANHYDDIEGEVLNLWTYFIALFDRWPDWNKDNFTIHFVASQFDRIWMHLKKESKPKSSGGDYINEINNHFKNQKNGKPQ